MMPWYADSVVREVGSGAWFITSVALSLIFIYYIIDKMTVDRQWRLFAPTFAAAVSLIFFGVGSAVRAFLSWAQWYDINRGYDPGPWTGLWPWFGASILLNVLGAALGVYVFAPLWRPCIAIGTIALSVVIPLVVFWNY